ncbi:MAG: hypothetical protein WD294_11650 [Phycisphaeraceae bacterium]
MFNPPEGQDPHHKPSPDRGSPGCASIVMWILAVLIILFAIYLAIGFIVEAPERTPDPEAPAANAAPIREQGAPASER